MGEMLKRGGIETQVFRTKPKRVGRPEKVAPKKNNEKRKKKRSKEDHLVKF